MQAEPDFSSRKRIQKLPPDLVNQIAAGEVVERPASVVKELVENALDAGATRVDVILKAGGIEEIQILDNGCGMYEEDLLLSVHPHATSKLSRSEDLEAIGTYGFRGEALASIASVSRMTITTRTRDSQSAYRLELVQGKTTGELHPVGAPVGTRVTVSHLFENIPARFKYLRSAATEFSHCSKMVRELALGLPHVAFHVHHNGRHLHQYVAGTLAARFRECTNFGWEPIVVDAECDNFSLRAFLSPPEATSERGELYLFVNGRVVRARALLGAVRRVYQESAGPGHDPSGALYLEIRKDWVDVNVHPQKWEIRLLHQEKLFGWMIASIRKGLPGPAEQVHSGFVPSSQVPAALSWVASPAPASATGLRFVSSLRPGWILVEGKDTLFIVDIKRFFADRYTRELASACKTGTVEVSELSAPILVDLSEEKLKAWDTRAESLRKLGFLAERFGDRTLRLLTIPSVLPTGHITEAIAALTDGPFTSDGVEALAKTLAVHHSSSPMEIVQLLSELGYDRDELKTSPGIYRLGFDEIRSQLEET